MGLGDNPGTAGAKHAAKSVAKGAAKKATQATSKDAAKESARGTASGTAKGAGEKGQAFPDRKLPRDKNGNFIPDSEYPHTQLGTKSGRNGKYPQAREFNSDGKPVRDMDFTDHGRSQNHSNPHVHDFVENETGGTLKRSKNPTPLK